MSSIRKAESDATAKKILFQPSTPMPDTGRHVLYDNSYDNLAGDHPSEKQLLTFSYENGNFTFYGVDSIGYYVGCKGYPSISHCVQIVPMIDTADATKGPTKEEILKAYVIINGEKVTVQKILQEGLNEEQARMLFDQEQTESGNKTIKIFGGVSKAFRILDPHQLAQINDIFYSERDIPLEGFLPFSDLKSLCENRELIKNSEWRSKLRVRVARMCTIKYRFMKHLLSRRILCMDAFLGSPASDKELELRCKRNEKNFWLRDFFNQKNFKGRRLSLL